MNPEVRRSPGRTGKCPLAAGADGGAGPERRVRSATDACGPASSSIPVPLTPVMVFVVTEQQALVATFAQKAISDIKPGMDAEVTFEAYPGKSFKVKVNRVSPSCRKAKSSRAGNSWRRQISTKRGVSPVSFEYGEDIAGSICRPVLRPAWRSIPTASDALSLVRKIISADEELGALCDLKRHSAEGRTVLSPLPYRSTFQSSQLESTS